MSTNGHSEPIKVVTEPKVYLVSRPTFIMPPHYEWGDGQGEGTDAEKLVEFAGRLCYDSFGKGRPSKAFHDNLYESGHGSVYEHPTFSFLVEHVSRTYTHEMVRHRAGFAYSQRSQRFVDESESEFVLPAEITDPEDIALWEESVRHSIKTYRALCESLDVKFKGANLEMARKRVRGAARSVLLNCVTTKIEITGNARAIYNVLIMRGSKHAEIEIRRVSILLHRLLMPEMPSLFSHLSVEEVGTGGFGLESDRSKL